MFIRINIDRTVKGIRPMIPAGVGARSMEGVFFGKGKLLIFSYRSFFNI